MTGTTPSGEAALVNFMFVSKLWATLNPLYTGGLFYCYMLEKSVCHFRGVGSILLLLFYFMMENPVNKQ